MDEGITLETLWTYVEQAVRGDRKLRAQLFRTMQRLANHPSAPCEERALGAVISQVLMGDRDPDLSSLPGEIAEEVRLLLQRL